MPIAVDEGIFVDFPDLAIHVPGLEVRLEVACIGLHAGADLGLDFLYVLIAL